MDAKNMDELCKMLKSRNKRGINSSIVVVAEGIEVGGKLIRDLILY
jgi:6-phosphofructokinase